MKITKSQLKQIIKEEIEKELDEGLGDWIKGGVEKLKGLGRKKAPSVDIETLKRTGKTGQMWAQAMEHPKGTAYVLKDWWFRAAGRGAMDRSMKWTPIDAKYSLEMLAAQGHQPPEDEKTVDAWAKKAAKDVPTIINSLLAQGPS